MSMLFSLAAGDGAFILTDGALYDGPILRGVASKVRTARQARFAVAWRGHHGTGEAIAEKLCWIADEKGASHVIQSLQDIVQDLRAGIEAEVQVVAAAYVRGLGGVHRAFATYQQEPWPAHCIGEEIPAFSVIPLSWSYWGSGSITGEQYLGYATRADPTTAFQPGESVEQWLRRTGADLMELMRKQRLRSQLTGEEFYSIGGKCDFTAVTAASAKTETLRTWPDKIGERIDPFRTAPIAGMNRKAGKRPSGRRR